MAIIIHAIFCVSLHAIVLPCSIVDSAHVTNRRSYIENPFLTFSDGGNGYYSTSQETESTEPVQDYQPYYCGVIDAAQVPQFSGRNGVLDEKYRWKSFIYYYDYFKPEIVNSIRTAVQLVKKVLPCIEFREAKSLYEFLTLKGHKAFFMHSKNTICYSLIGNYYWKDIGGKIEIGSSCYTWVHTIVHEIFHALGLEHEQCRADRDMYIDVHYENIKKELWSAFDTVDSSYSDYGIPYNIHSVMHYGDRSYGIDGKKTFTPRPGVRFPRENDLGHGVQFSDMVKLRKMYNCKYDEVKDVDLF